jgi:hypothetical protein
MSTLEDIIAFMKKKDTKDLKAQYEVNPQLLILLHMRKFAGDHISGSDTGSDTGTLPICMLAKLSRLLVDFITR